MKRGIVRNIMVAVMWDINLTLALFCYVIVWLDRKFKFRFAFPRNTAELAQREQWCIRALSENGMLPANAKVQRFSVTPMKQELIFRSDIGIAEVNYTVEDERKTLKCIAK